MAENLLAVRARERDRGPTLVLAHNRHLQRHDSTWLLAGMHLRWSGAGAVLAALLGDRYVLVTGALGESSALGLGPPAPGTIEAAVGEVAGVGPALLDAAALRAAVPDGVRLRDDVTPEQGYFPLDRETLEGSDAVLYLSARTVAAEDLTSRIRALPDVGYLFADEASGAPEPARGTRFFFAGDDRMMPFATITDRDMPGDDDSRLDRPGVHRLNLQLGREEFVRRFGFRPAELDEHRADLDFTAADVLLPHPVYGRQGWGCVVGPTTASLRDLDELLRHAHARAMRRAERRAEVR
jgi:hypothetical protein